MHLAVTGLGMTSCLANGAAANAALMRCQYSGFDTTDFIDPDAPGRYLTGAAALREPGLRGLDLYLSMIQQTVTEAIGPEPPPRPIPLLLCMQETSRPNILMSSRFSHDLYEQFVARYQDIPCTLHFASSEGRTSWVRCLFEARKQLAIAGVDQVIVLGLDSLLNTRAINHYIGQETVDRRLFGDDYSNGFIPGEAAVAVCLSQPDGSPQTLITGIGRGEEPAPIYSGEVLRTEGLSTAIRAAADEAGIRVCETDFRISSANGEEYWYREASLAQSRTLEAPCPHQSLWHTADHIGEVGAASGPAMLVMAHYAFEKGYAPGPRALCQLSNDDSERAAFILERSDAL